MIQEGYREREFNTECYLFLPICKNDLTDKSYERQNFCAFPCHFQPDITICTFQNIVISFQLIHRSFDLMKNYHFLLSTPYDP